MEVENTKSAIPNPKSAIERLPHTFEAFLSRFGRLTQIQTLALEPLLDGKNCVLAAATASGKTEAALAPILERYQKQRFRFNQTKQTSTVKFLYLVPTKALARDIARRIEQPLAKLAIGLAIKTGDEPSLKPNRPPEFLITTPESLDSILANRPKMLRDVRAVVLDELHLYDNTPRGDQLRILLNRLRRLRKYACSRGDSATNEMQFCALSATIHNPVTVAEQYFTNPVLIKTEGHREIEAELYEMHGVLSLLELFATFKERNIKKVLAFCQKRAECEEWVNLLHGIPPFGDEVLVHHANLSKHLRHQAEEKFTRTGAALCFATSTLELGIDIGDVDLILLIGAPDNLGSFLQRIGRGNRRTKQTKVACFYRSKIEEAIFQIFLRAAKNSDAETMNLLNSESGLPFRPSVVVQQLCSYLKQTTHSELDTEHAFSLFSTPQGEPLIDKNQYHKIIENLLEKDFFKSAMHGGKQLQAGEMWEKLYEERTLYSNLSGTNESPAVFDDLTGKLVGYLDSKMPVGSKFLMGGHARRIISTKGKRFLTRAENISENVRPAPQKWHWKVKSSALTRALAKELGFPVAEANEKMTWVKIQTDSQVGSRNLLFHCAGEVYGKALSELLETKTTLNIIDQNEFFIEFTGEFSDAEITFSENEMNGFFTRRWKTFENAFDLGRFQEFLPKEVRRNSVLNAFNVPKFKEFCSKVQSAFSVF